MLDHEPSTRRMRFERLEDRTLLATVSLTAGVLTLVGDEGHDKATVKVRGAEIQAEIISKPAGGGAAVKVAQSFALGSVSSIVFEGHNGNDSFISHVALPVSAWGGAGKDFLQGGGAADTLHGGPGNDRLKGWQGNDHLYGEAGNDKLVGMAGHDGLFGGDGKDALIGGPGADRFLQMLGQREAKDAGRKDAVIFFRNDAGVWADSEIEQIDGGLKQLHLKTGNNNLLQTPLEGPLTFWRGQAAAGGALAENHGLGKIVVMDAALSGPAGQAALVVVHEASHSWDTVHLAWSQWLAFSGWRPMPATPAELVQFQTSDDGQWSFPRSEAASFARDYGRQNPREDFATAWESYFVFQHGVPNAFSLAPLRADKLAHLDAFFASLA